MPLIKGHTFTDGETVTAAKLNNLVDLATVGTDTIVTSMIKDTSVTANKLATDAVTGAVISSNTINFNSLVNATGSTKGTILQSGVGGVFEELTPHSTSGLPLKSAGANAPLVFGALDNVGVGANLISGHDEDTAPASDDTILTKDTSAGANKKVQLGNIFKSISGLGSLTSGTIDDADELDVLDTSDSTPKRVSKSDLGLLKKHSSEINLEDVWGDTNGIAELTHSLSAVPTIIQAFIECEATNALHGWAIGDRISLGSVLAYDDGVYYVAFSTVGNTTKIFVTANRARRSGSIVHLPLYIPKNYGSSPSSWGDHEVVNIGDTEDGGSDLRSDFKLIIKAFA